MQEEEKIIPISELASGGGDTSKNESVPAPTDSVDVTPPVPLTKQEIEFDYQTFLEGGEELFNRFTEEIKRLRGENYVMGQRLLLQQKIVVDMKSEFDRLCDQFEDIGCLRKRIEAIKRQNFEVWKKKIETRRSINKKG